MPELLRLCPKPLLIGAKQKLKAKNAHKPKRQLVISTSYRIPAQEESAADTLLSLHPQVAMEEVQRHTALFTQLLQKLHETSMAIFGDG